jgi:hypothetical protein
LSGRFITTPDELELLELELLELELLLELLDELELVLLDELELLDEPPGPPEELSAPHAARPIQDPIINIFIIFIVSPFSQKNI